MVTVRRDTPTILSKKGISKISPGPLTPVHLPRKKITARSYSLIILTETKNIITSMGERVHHRYTIERIIYLRKPKINNYLSTLPVKPEEAIIFWAILAGTSS